MQIKRINLGPLLFNIFMFELFFLMAESNIANYADDKATLYACEKNLLDYLRILESDSAKLFQWFNNNYSQF